MKSMSKHFTLSLILAVSLGFVVGLTFLLLGIEHNSQNEFISESGELDLWYSLKIVLSAGGLAFVIFILLAAIIRIVYSFKRS